MIEPPLPAHRDSARAIAIEAAVALAAFAALLTAYFAPVAFGPGYLAPGDGLIYYVPALLSEPHWWNLNLYAGFPSFADPQALVMSPLRVFGSHYDAAVVAIYVIAATGAFVLVRVVTGLRSAGALAGVCFGTGGPMVAHLGHLTIIWSAAWMPWMLAGVALARTSSRVWPLAGGALALGLASLGCHPQILVYGGALAVAYAMFLVASAPAAERRALVLRYTVLFLTGALFAAIQLVPLAEMAQWSLRSNMTFAEFVTYSQSLKHFALFVFPNLFGGYPGYRLPYFGSWNLTELAVYSGIATLMLAIAAVCAREREREVLFWVAVVVVGILYSLGEITPVAKIAFHLPVVSQFRVPARTALCTSLALAVLAGYGLRALLTGRLSEGRGRAAAALIAIFFLTVLAGVYLNYPKLVAQAAQKQVAVPALHANSAILVPLVLVALSAACIYAIARRVKGAVPALVVLLAADLATFGWFYEWRQLAPPGLPSRDSAWQKLAADVRAEHTRVLFADGAYSALPARPNLNLLYDLPSTSGYGPLMLRDYAEVTQTNPTGSLDSYDGLARRLALTGTAWLAYDRSRPRPLHLGGDCSPAQGIVDATAAFTPPVRASHLEIVSHLGCSVEVEQDRPVLAIAARTGAGTVSTVELRAGRDTAEWAIDRPDLAGKLAHGRPPNAEPFASDGFNGQWFRSRVPLDAGGQPADVASLALRWLAAPGPGINIRSIELVDAAAGSRTLVAMTDFMSTGFRAGEVRRVGLHGHVVRFADAKPVAWLVGRTLPTASDATLSAIRSGRLADGSDFDPHATALVPLGAALATNVQAQGAPGQARIVRREHGSYAIDVDATRPAFVVLAESRYPGWRAEVDGTEVPIVVTNGAFQGVATPAGKHTVVFSFRSPSLLLGFAAAVLGILVLIGYSMVLRVGNRRRDRRQAPRTSS